MDSPWTVLLFPFTMVVAAIVGAITAVKGVVMAGFCAIMAVLSLATLPVWGPVLVIKGWIESREAEAAAERWFESRVG